MSGKEERIVGALKRVNSGISHINQGDASTGTYDPATGALYANPAYGLDQGYIWVRRGGARHAVRARNVNGIAPLSVVNFPVKVGENTSDGGLDVIGINWEKARDIFGDAVYQAAQQPRLVSAEEIGVLRIYLAETGSFKFRASPGYYWDSAGELKWWPDPIGSEVDISANVAATADHHNLSVISLDNDATTPALTSIASTEQSISASLTRENVTLVSVPDGYYPLGAVHHYNADTTPRSAAEVWRLGVFVDNGVGPLTGLTGTRLANTVYAGPAGGIAATPTFRALVKADLPVSAIAASELATRYEPLVFDGELVFYNGDIVMAEVTN